MCVQHVFVCIPSIWEQSAYVQVRLSKYTRVNHSVHHQPQHLVYAGFAVTGQFSRYYLNAMVFPLIWRIIHAGSKFDMVCLLIADPDYEASLHHSTP